MAPLQGRERSLVHESAVTIRVRAVVRAAGVWPFAIAGFGLVVFSALVALGSPPRRLPVLRHLRIEISDSGVQGAYERVPCSGVAARIALERSRPAPPFVVRGEVAMEDLDTTRSTFSIACEGVEIVGHKEGFAPGPRGSLVVKAPSSLLVRTRPDGAVEVDRICMACDEVGAPILGASVFVEPGVPTLSPLQRGARVAGALGPALLILAWVARSRRVRLARALGDAPPVASWPVPFSCDRLALEGPDGARIELTGPVIAHRGGAPSAGEPAETPRIETTPGGRGYREGSGEPPRFIGPGQVNGLRVHAGAPAALADGDVVRFGRSAAYVVHLPGAPEPMRYRVSPAGEQTLIALVPASAVTLLLALLLSPIAGVCLFAETPSWSTALVAALVVTVLCAAAVPSQLSRHAPLRLRLSAGPPRLSTPSGIQHRVERAVLAAGEGGWRLSVIDEAGGELVLEDVPALALGAPREVRALHEALRRELDPIVRRLEAGGS
jgi:hypothetical protein